MNPQPSKVIAEIEQQVQQYKLEGNSLFLAKNFEGAIRLYSQGLATDPKHLILLSNRSAAYLELKDYANALADSQKCVEIDSKFFKGWARIG